MQLRIVTEAYVTLATNDRYALGALVLAHSLREVNTTRQLCVLISPEVTDAIRSQLSGVFDNVVCVDIMDSKDSAHLALLKRPELGITFTKLHCWTLTQYTKCVFLDADMLAVQNADELFDRPELSAACDIGWPDCFNSGMFVFSPSQDTYARLLEHAEKTGSFDGGDQGLLNTFFSDWTRLSFIYNMVASAAYTYLPAYKQYGQEVKFVHFLGATKPWQQSYHSDSGTVVSQPGQEHISSHLNAWWRIFAAKVKPGLPEAVTTPLTAASSSEDHHHHHHHHHQQPQDVPITYDTHFTPHTNETQHSNEQQQVMTKPQEGECQSVCEPQSHFYPDPQEPVRITPSPPPIPPAVHEEKKIETLPPPPPTLYPSNEQSHCEQVIAQTHEEVSPVVHDISTPHVHSDPKPPKSEVPVITRAFSHKYTQTTEFDLAPVDNVGKNLKPTRPSPPKPVQGDTHVSRQRAVPMEVCVSDSQPVGLSTTKPVVSSTISSSAIKTTAIPTTTTLLNEPCATTPITTMPDKDTTTTPTAPSSAAQFKPYRPSYYPPSPHSTKVVPELRQTYENEGATRFMGPAERRPALGAGGSGRAPLPAQYDNRFQPLKCSRLPSPFSGQGAARAASEQGLSTELVTPMEGLNISAKESVQESLQRWEQGQPDFRGRDSFDNILAHIESKVNEN